MTDLATAVLEFAAGEIGVKEDPPRSNRGPRVDQYLRYVGLDAVRASYPWCAAFVSFCVGRSAEDWPTPRQFRGSSRCLRLVQVNQALLLTRAEVGCVFVNLEPDTTGHCGIVTAVTDEWIETIEGNTDAGGSRTGGQVMRQRRGLDYAEAYLRIA